MITLKNMQVFHGRHCRSIRILDTVAPDWEKIAMAIGFNASHINAIAREHPNDVEQACLQVFVCWLTDDCSPDLKRPLPKPTWRALHGVLLDAGLNHFAQELGEVLGGL